MIIYGTQAVHIKAASDYNQKHTGTIYWQGKAISAIQNPIFIQSKEKENLHE